MSTDPRQLEHYAKSTLVEELMWLCGQAEPDPAQTRRKLEQLSYEQLSTMLNQVMEAIC